MSEFSKDSFVKIVGINGNYRYGFIQNVTERGFHYEICLHEEGDSAMEYESQAGSLMPDWDQELTDVEKNIVPLLADDFSTNEIATELGVSPVTIRSQVRTLRIKLGLDNRAQLIAFAQAVVKRLKEEE